MVRAVKKEAIARTRRDEDESSNGSNHQEAHERRVLRSRYLAVKNLISDEREGITRIDSYKFSSIITQVESLHKLVLKPREQVADAEALLDITNTLVTSVKSQSNDGISPSDFVSVLLKNFGQQGGGAIIDSSPNIVSWIDVDLAVSHIFRKVPGCCTMVGPMTTEMKQRKLVVQRKRLKPTTSTYPEEISSCTRMERISRSRTLRRMICTFKRLLICTTYLLLAQLDDAEPEAKTDTDKNMAAMFDILRRKRSVRLDNLVLNRVSFAQTVENIFALSFLVKDGRAEITVNNSEHHLVSPRNAPSAAAVSSGDASYNHFVFRFDFKDWKLMRDTIEPGEELMPQRNNPAICGSS